MSSRRFIARTLIPFVAATLAAASAATANPTPESVAETDVVRVLPDESRSRVWILTSRAVYLRESGAPTKRFTMPGRVHMDCAGDCQPDLLVEPAGSVLVSSNIQPDLWRIDPEAASSVKVPIALEQDSGKDFGFTQLRFGPHGQIDVRGTLDRAEWQIDLAAQRASKRPDQPR